MTITSSEMRLMMEARELAEAAGLDDNREPRRFSDFCARAEELIRQAERRGYEAGREEALMEMHWL